MHIYDYIVIGSGLTGLQIASEISQHTQNILLLESDVHIGGAHRPAQLTAGLNSYVIDNGLRFFPNTEISRQAILRLENYLGIKLIKNSMDNIPHTYEASGFKPFMGFGDRAPAFYSELSYFLSSSEIELTIPYFQIIELLKNKFQGELALRSYVTRFNRAENSADNQITSVTVNGAKTYSARNFIFTGSVNELPLLLSDDILNLRQKAKLKKETAWLSLSLDLLHQNSPKTDSNLFVLNGTTDDEIGPCVGRFCSASNGLANASATEMQISQWMSFIDAATAEETENIAEVLKKMKRQIKRAFPQQMESAVTERIFVSGSLTCGELKLNANGTLPLASNLWVSSAQLSPYKNIVGSLLQAQITLASLGFAEALLETSAPEQDQEIRFTL